MIIQENYLINEEKQRILTSRKYFLGCPVEPQSEVFKCESMKYIHAFNLAKRH